MPGPSQGRVGTLRVLRPVGAHLGGLAVVVVVVVLDVVALGVVLVGLGAVGLAVRVPGKESNCSRYFRKSLGSFKSLGR